MSYAHGKQYTALVPPRSYPLLAQQRKVTAQTFLQVLVRSLRYEETVQLGCRHLGCDELDPLVGVALYLQTNGTFVFYL